MLINTTMLTNVFNEVFEVNLKEISPGVFSVEIIANNTVLISKNFDSPTAAALESTAVCDFIKKKRLHRGAVIEAVVVGRWI